MDAHALGGAFEQQQARCLGHIRGVDVGPQRFHRKQVLRDHEGGGDLLQRRAFLFGQFEGMNDAQPVHDAVGELGRDELAPEPVGKDFGPELFLHRHRKVGQEHRFERGVSGQRAVLDRIL